MARLQRRHSTPERVGIAAAISKYSPELKERAMRLGPCGRSSRKIRAVRPCISPDGSASSKTPPWPVELKCEDRGLRRSAAPHTCTKRKRDHQGNDQSATRSRPPRFGKSTSQSAAYTGCGKCSRHCAATPTRFPAAPDCLWFAGVIYVRRSAFCGWALRRS
jgi:hypothetical protein